MRHPAALVVLALTSLASAETVLVTVTGTVESTFTLPPPLAGIEPGDPASMTFRLDSGDWTDPFPDMVRAYGIVPNSFRLHAGPFEVGLRNTSSSDACFKLRRTTSSSSFGVSRHPDLPYDPQLDLMGPLMPMEVDWNVSYPPDTLSSFDLLDAVGTYGVAGTTLDSWRIKDPFLTDVEIAFETITIEADASACRADVDGDQAVGVNDLVAVIASWGMCGACAADVDGSGLVDTADLVAVIAAWGACE